AEPGRAAPLEPIRAEDLDEVLAAGRADVIDVREMDERDGGYIPGTRHVPYRLLRACAGDLTDGRPVVTICESGPRAVVAASVLRAAGIDARPVVGGGIVTWHGNTVGFRRCGA